MPPSFSFLWCFFLVRSTQSWHFLTLEICTFGMSCLSVVSLVLPLVMLQGSRSSIHLHWPTTCRGQLRPVPKRSSLAYTVGMWNPFYGGSATWPFCLDPWVTQRWNVERWGKSIQKRCKTQKLIRTLRSRQRNYCQQNLSLHKKDQDLTNAFLWAAKVEQREPTSIEIRSRFL